MDSQKFLAPRPGCEDTVRSSTGGYARRSLTTG